MTDNELDDVFKALRQTETGDAGQALEMRLRAGFRQKQRGNRIRTYALEIAASMTVVLGLYFLLSNGGVVPPERATGGTGKGEEQFVVLPYGQSDVPLEHPFIVRVQVAGEELSQLGVSLPTVRKHARVEADLLVGQDGIARAVRVNRSF